jgi:ATP-dependent Clp protease protease subunit
LHEIDFGDRECSKVKYYPFKTDSVVKIFFTTFSFTSIMPKELYLYSPIYDFVAQDLISSMDEEGNDEDLTMRMNTPGGSVFSGWGIAAKMMERKGKTTVKVDGAAMSMGAMLLCFADRVEALDVSTIMLHRADMYVENAEDQAFLDTINATLREKMKSKIDDKKLKELKGVNIKNLFEDEKRIDLFLTAKEAKAIGLVDKINTLTPKELTAFNSKMFAIAATHEPVQKPITIPNQNTMNLEKLKAEHPELFAQIIAMGVEKEKDRVEACLTFIECDPIGVKAAIEAGKDLSQKQMAEFALKALSKNSLTAIAASAAPAIVTTEAGATTTEAETKLSAFEIEAKKALGLKGEKK